MIRKLNESESLKEISRMISGDQWSETSMEHAKEMKSLADETYNKKDISMTICPFLGGKI